jgi:melanoma-associated antigen
MRQGYIDRQDVGDTKGTGGKRGRPSLATQRENGGTWQWRWGNRAESEVGEMNIAKFAAEFMIERAGDDAMEEEEEEGTATKGKGKGKGKGMGKGKAKQNAGYAEKRMAAIMKAIERAAGGNLVKVD